MTLLRFRRSLTSFAASACVLALAWTFIAGAAGRQRPRPASACADSTCATAGPRCPAHSISAGLRCFEVINILANELHINYIVDPAVKGGSVTMNTYGTVRDVDIRPLLETILRMKITWRWLRWVISIGLFPRPTLRGSLLTTRSRKPDASKTSRRRTPGSQSCHSCVMSLPARCTKFCLPYMGDGAQYGRGMTPPIS